MPGAAIEGRDEEGNYLGGMLVAFGPKKIRFRGRVAVETDFAGAHRLAARPRRGRHASGADRGTHRLRVARRSADARRPRSVKLTSDAELGGVLADFARTGGVPFANALMQDFSKRVAEEFATEKRRVKHRRSEPMPLAAHGLLWQVIMAKLTQFARWLGFARA